MGNVMVNRPVTPETWSAYDVWAMYLSDRSRDRIYVMRQKDTAIREKSERCVRLRPACNTNAASAHCSRTGMEHDVQYVRMEITRHKYIMCYVRA
jgi:hypothetical protein